MRITGLAFSIFCFVLALNLLTELNLLPWTGQVGEPQVPNVSSFQPPPSDPYGISLVVYGVTLLVKILLQSTVLLWQLLMLFGVPMPVAIVINVIVNLLYVLGVLQIYTKTRVED